MTKAEAQEEMRKGIKVTHRYFSDDEWITLKGFKILTEEGYLHNQIEFWSYRTSSSFNNDWSLWKSELELQKEYLNVIEKELLSILQLINSKSLDYWNNNWTAFISLKNRTNILIEKFKTLNYE